MSLDGLRRELALLDLGELEHSMARSSDRHSLTTMLCWP